MNAAGQGGRDSEAPQHCGEFGHLGVEARRAGEPVAIDPGVAGQLAQGRAHGELAQGRLAVDRELAVDRHRQAPALAEFAAVERQAVERRRAAAPHPDRAPAQRRDEGEVEPARETGDADAGRA